MDPPAASPVPGPALQTLPVDPSGAASSVRDAIEADPLLAVGVGAAAVLLVAGIAALLRYWRRSPGERFAAAVGESDAVAVLMHPNPDPDAMACALAAAEIADREGTDATLYYPGEIRHQENRAFKTVLELDAERTEHAADLDGEVVLVDHNEARGFGGAGGVEPLAVVDHHPGGGTGAAFTDVRADYGACATVFAEYLRDTTPPPDDDGAEPGEALDDRLATGLLCGIHADTDNLTNGCHTAEFEASAYLYPGVDPDALDRVANPEVDAEVLDVMARAIEGRDVRNAFAVSDVEGVSNVDAIPQAADELVRLEGVTAVVVFGDRDGTVHLSGRSRDDRVHMGDALAAAVEDIPMAGAGGHARMGGGQLSADHMQGLATEGVPRDALAERLFDAMQGDLQ